MNYIYDILLNFNEEMYDFYDWNKNDYILHIRKIPFFKVNALLYQDFKSNYVKLAPKFLNEIKNKTEIFTNKNMKNITYSFLITDGLEVLGILVTSQSIKYSKLLIDEEIECLEMSNRMKEYEIEYQIIKKKKAEQFKTRREIEMKNYIYKELNRLFEENNHEKLEYLYYECFNNKIDNISYIKNNFLNKIKNEKKVYDVLKLIQESK